MLSMRFLRQVSSFLIEAFLFSARLGALTPSLIFSEYLMR